LSFNSPCCHDVAKHYWLNNNVDELNPTDNHISTVKKELPAPPLRF